MPAAALRRECAQGEQRHRGGRTAEGRRTAPLHEQVGVLRARLLARRVDQQCCGLRRHTFFEGVQVLQEPGAGPVEVESVSDRRQLLRETGGRGGLVPPGQPCALVLRRGRRREQPDHELERGGVEIRPRPCERHDGIRVDAGRQVRRRHAGDGPAAALDGQPRLREQVESSPVHPQPTPLSMS